VDLILATRNAHKLREVSRMLAPYGLGVQPLPDHVVLPPEDGHTFEENALPKAQTAAAALGVPVIADDSGIESAALGGRPGVRSARFAGEHATDAQNLQKLLAEAPAGSALRYVCALAFVGADGEQRVFFGECTGRLAEAPRGDRGFGYDPAFLPDDGPPGLTMAELEDATKDAISHRGRALSAFARWFTAEHR
jgi:XTP/dITP diphosphohydrolase